MGVTVFFVQCERVICIGALKEENQIYGTLGERQKSEI